MLHPVGELPAAVYWRRRLLVLVVLPALLAGGGWVAARLLGPADVATTAASATTAAPSRTTPPALERVLPPLAGVRTPATVPRTPTVERRTAPATPAPAPATEPEPEPSGPAPGSRCTDDMVALTMGVPEPVASGSKPTFRMVLTNTSPVPCVRTLDAELREMVILDADGTRLWGSNDCFPEKSDDRRRLGSGESVTLSLLWGGLTSDPGCSADRAALPPGDYLLRGRLHTAVTDDVPLRIT